MIYLVAVDGSKWSIRAAERAITLAQKTGAEVHFLTVIAPLGMQLSDETAPVSGREFEKATSREIFDPLKEQFAGSGVEIKYELFWGHPVDVIHEHAKKEHVNMIFVGRRGRSKVMGLLLGSVANSLAHTAGVPIVLVP